LAKPKAPTVRRVKSKEDRKRPSVFLRLKTDENFKAHAMFEPDPELDDNPGYFEYYDHYDNQANAYVPCAGDMCPFCHANDNPSTRALTVWYFPDAKKDEQLKVFTANYSTINTLADESEDEDGILGKMLRIRRLDDRGSYRVKSLSDKPLTKTEIKSVMKQVDDLNLPGMVDRQLQIQMERLKAIEALEDDDDEDEDEPRPKGKGKAIVEDVEEEDEEEDEEEEEDEDEAEEEEDEEEEEEEEEEDEPGEISGSFEVVKLNEAEETVDLKDWEGGKLKMWFGEGVGFDADVIKKGTTAIVEALQDDEGDWVITSFEAEKPKSKGRAGKGKTKGKTRSKK
jgi:hypothetical protein